MYLWNLKKRDTGELTCKIGTDSQTLKIYSYQREQTGGEGWTGGGLKMEIF